MTSVLPLIDPAWRDIQFDYHMIQPGDPLSELRGVSLAVDVETKPLRTVRKAGLSAFHGELLGVSVGCPELRACWYVPLRHQSPGSARMNVDPAPVMAWLRDAMSNARVLMNHNIKFDAKFLDRAGVPATSYDHVPIYDSQIAAVLIDERVESGLKPTCARLLGMPADEAAAIEPYKVGAKDYQDWSYVPADVMAPYGCGDVERAIKLAAIQRAMLASEEVEDLFELEMRVCRDLIHMELRGHRVDVPLLQADLPKLILHEVAVGARIEQLVGASVNYESPKDLAEMFVTRLGLPILSSKPGKDRATGKEIRTPVFDGAVLQTYARVYPQHAELMFRIRQARRLGDMKAFVQAYLEAQVDGVIHTTIKQVEARTGRESSEMPNLQQISGEEEWDFPFSPELPMLSERIRIRDGGVYWVSPGCEKYFIAREGHTILSFDYSQVEYRFFAHYLNHAALIDRYKNDPTTDLHQWVADEILHGAISRDDAKSANFGMVFGMGDKKLVKFMATNGVGITEDQAHRALEDYYKAVPLEALQDGVGRRLMEKGFVKTILGRRRRMTKHRRQWGQERNKERDRGLEPYQALNAICQGGAVDLLKHRSVEARARAQEFGGELILKVHDDVKLEVPTEMAETCATEVKPILETFVKPDGTPYLRLPLTTKCTRTETSWYDARKLEVA